ncbi:MAG: Mur ligase family protein, partial [Eggerthella lenta]
MSKPQSGETAEYGSDAVIKDKKAIDDLTSMLKTVVTEHGQGRRHRRLQRGGQDAAAEIYDEKNGGYRKRGSATWPSPVFLADSSSQLVCFVGANEVPTDGVVTPIFKDIMTTAIDRFNIYPGEEAMGKTCTELFAGIDCTILGNADDEVNGIAYRSDRVQPGDAFFCVVGMTTMGTRSPRRHRSGRESARGRAQDVPGRRYGRHGDRGEGYAQGHGGRCSELLRPSFQDLALVGITGTNGKTTATYLVEHIARVAGKRTGVIGTVGIRIGDEAEKSAHTTPESPDLQQLLARMRDARCDVVAMEVSSHALDLDRTWDAAFAVTAFSNLTQDHLDYHHTFEAYFEAKARLFSKDYPAKRVICIDDKWGKELLRRCSVAEDSVVTTGFDPSAQIHPVDVQYAPTHTTITLDVRGSLHTFDYPLVGKFNV